MKRLIIIFFLFIPGFLFGEGPLFQHKNSITQQEFENTYQDLRRISRNLTNTTSSTSTFCIDDPTFCVNITSHDVGINISTPVGNGLTIGQQGLTVTKDGDGDLWITANAYFDGTNWIRVDTTTYSFGIELIATGNFPGEAEPGLAVWRASSGANPIGTSFGSVGSWELGWDSTAFRDLVIGGRTIEMDGVGLSPFGRFFHSNSQGPSYTGIVTNLFGDLSGADVSNSPGWIIARKNDSFVVQRSSLATYATLEYFLEMSTQSDSGKNTYLYTHLISSAATPSITSCGSSPSVSGTDMAGKITTGGGVITSCTLTFAKTYAVAPVCTINDETAIQLIRATPSTTTLVIDSATAITSAVIDYICIGKP